MGEGARAGEFPLPDFKTYCKLSARMAVHAWKPKGWGCMLCGHRMLCQWTQGPGVQSGHCKIIKLPDRWYLYTDITTEKKMSADFNKDNLQVKECFKQTALR